MRTGSWFSNYPKIALKTLLEILFNWSCGSAKMNALEVQTGVSRRSLSKIHSNLERIIIKRLNATVQNRKLGGLGKYVVMDESFGLHPKVGLQEIYFVT